MPANPNSRAGSMFAINETATATSTTMSASLLGPRQISRSSMTGPRTMSPSPRQLGLSLQRERLNRGDATGLQHRGSTKQLISHYESMQPTDFSRSPFSVPRSSFSKHRSDFFAHTQEKTAPLRRSFRNLLSVFKKVKPQGKPNETLPEDSSIALRNIIINLDLNKGSIPPSFDNPDSHHSSPLLYLSRSSRSDPSGHRILPVWTPCTAYLRNDHILLTWLTAHGNPFTHTIPLVSFADVHSLALDELGAEEKALLPTMSEPERPRVFEIAFDGRTPEKFASGSVQDRAEWVTAIWDRVLEFRECKPRGAVAEADLGISETAHTVTKSAFMSSRNVPESEHQPGANKLLGRLERSLPPMLKESLPMAQPKGGSPYDPSISRATSPTSTRSPPSMSRRNSSSIANLSNASLVQQRIAQIERNNSRSSTSSLGGRPTVDLAIPSGAIKTYSHSDALQRQSSRRSTASVGESIVDSYAETRSPKFLYARAGSDPSMITYCGSRRSEKLMSPISEYSEKGDVDTTSAFEPRSMKPLPDVPEGECSAVKEPSAHALFDGSREALRKSNDSDEDKDTFREVRRKLEIIHGDIQQKFDANTIIVLRAAEEIQRQLGTHLPEILQKVSEASFSGSRESATLCETSARDPEKTSASGAEPTESSTADHLSAIQAKLDGLLNVLNNKGSDNDTAAMDCISSVLADILTLSKRTHDHHAIQTQQQADNVRYLHELNSWLENFVNNGTSQIQSIGEDVQRLCLELGCAPSQVEADTKCGPLANVERLLFRIASRTESISHLEPALQSLFSRMRAQDVDVIAQLLTKLLDQQRHGQESMIRDLASELTNEIRDERLRFIDAMREATEINIQNQITQLRRELAREMHHQSRGYESRGL